MNLRFLDWLFEVCILLICLNEARAGTSGSGGILKSDQKHRTQKAAEKANELHCYMCQTLDVTKNYCTNVSRQDVNISSKCAEDRRICMVKKVSFIAMGENSTGHKPWSIERSCTHRCEPGCIVIGERLKLRKCVSCCDTNFCNWGSGAPSSPVTNVPMIAINTFFLIVPISLKVSNRSVRLSSTVQATPAKSISMNTLPKRTLSGRGSAEVKQESSYARAKMYDLNQRQRSRNSQTSREKNDLSGSKKNLASRESSMGDSNIKVANDNGNLRSSTTSAKKLMPDSKTSASYRAKSPSLANSKQGSKPRSSSTKQRSSTRRSSNELEDEESSQPSTRKSSGVKHSVENNRTRSSSGGKRNFNLAENSESETVDTSDFHIEEDDLSEIELRRYSASARKPSNRRSSSERRRSSNAGHADVQIEEDLVESSLSDRKISSKHGSVPERKRSSHHIEVDQSDIDEKFRKQLETNSDEVSDAEISIPSSRKTSSRKLSTENKRSSLERKAEFDRSEASDTSYLNVEEASSFDEVSDVEPKMYTVGSKESSSKPSSVSSKPRSSSERKSSHEGKKSNRTKENIEEMINIGPSSARKSSGTRSSLVSSTPRKSSIATRKDISSTEKVYESSLDEGSSTDPHRSRKPSVLNRQGRTSSERKRSIAKVNESDFSEDPKMIVDEAIQKSMRSKISSASNRSRSSAEGKRSSTAVADDKKRSISPVRKSALSKPSRSSERNVSSTHRIDPIDLQMEDASSVSEESDTDRSRNMGRSAGRKRSSTVAEVDEVYKETSSTSPVKKSSRSSVLSRTPRSSERNVSLTHMIEPINLPMGDENDTDLRRSSSKGRSTDRKRSSTVAQVDDERMINVNKERSSLDRKSSRSSDLNRTPRTSERNVNLTHIIDPNNLQMGDTDLRRSSNNGRSTDRKRSSTYSKLNESEMSEATKLHQNTVETDEPELSTGENVKAEKSKASVNSQQRSNSNKCAERKLSSAHHDGLYIADSQEHSIDEEKDFGVNKNIKNFVESKNSKSSAENQKSSALPDSNESDLVDANIDLNEDENNILISTDFKTPKYVALVYESENFDPENRQPSSDRFQTKTLGDEINFPEDLPESHGTKIKGPSSVENDIPRLDKETLNKLGFVTMRSEPFEVMSSGPKCSTDSDLRSSIETSAKGSPSTDVYEFGGSSSSENTERSDPIEAKNQDDITGPLLHSGPRSDPTECIKTDTDPNTKSSLPEKTENDQLNSKGSSAVATAGSSLAEGIDSDNMIRELEIQFAKTVLKEHSLQSDPQKDVNTLEAVREELAEMRGQLIKAWTRSPEHDLDGITEYLHDLITELIDEWVKLATNIHDRRRKTVEYFSFQGVRGPAEFFAEDTRDLTDKFEIVKKDTENRMTEIKRRLSMLPSRKDHGKKSEDEDFLRHCESCSDCQEKHSKKYGDEDYVSEIKKYSFLLSEAISSRELVEKRLSEKEEEHRRTMDELDELKERLLEIEEEFKREQEAFNKKADEDHREKMKDQLKRSDFDEVVDEAAYGGSSENETEREDHSSDNEDHHHFDDALMSDSESEQEDRCGRRYTYQLIERLKNKIKILRATLNQSYLENDQTAIDESEATAALRREKNAVVKALHDAVRSQTDDVKKIDKILEMMECHKAEADARRTKIQQKLNKVNTKAFDLSRTGSN